MWCTLGDLGKGRGGGLCRLAKATKPNKFSLLNTQKKQKCRNRKSDEWIGRRKLFKIPFWLLPIYSECLVAVCCCYILRKMKRKRTKISFTSGRINISKLADTQPTESSWTWRTEAKPSTLLFLARLVELFLLKKAEKVCQMAQFGSERN